MWSMKKYLGKLFDWLDIDIPDLINFFRGKIFVSKPNFYVNILPLLKLAQFFVKYVRCYKDYDNLF